MQMVAAMPMLWNVAASSGASSFELSLMTSGFAGAKLLHRQLAEIGQAVVADDVPRPRRRPVAADGEAVLVRIHVGIGAAGHAEMLAHHARGDGEDRVGIGALRGLLAQGVEELQPGFVLAQLRVARTPCVVSTTMAMTPIGRPLSPSTGE